MLDSGLLYVIIIFDFFYVKGRFLVNVDFGPPKLAFEILRTNEITSYLSDLRGDWTK